MAQEKDKNSTGTLGKIVDKLVELPVAELKTVLAILTAMELERKLLTAEAGRK